VTTFHDLRIPYIFPKAGAFRWKSMLALARYSDAVICTDRENLQLLQQQLPLPEGSQRNSAPLLKLIPLGSNVEPQPPANYDRTAWRAKYGFTPDTFLMAYFGFLNESKGGEALIQALALLRQQGFDAQLLLIGGEVGHADPTNLAYAEQIQDLIQQYELTSFVHRTGYVELPEVSAHLLAADAVVMPYREGVSFRRTSLIAALRHGRPVVTTLPPEPQLIPEIQHGQNMLLAPPAHAAALAQTIGVLIGDPQLQTQLAAGAKALGARFEWTTIAAETRQLYQAIAG
jgi:glycosyltransferase involved in cell wall biosynthesis